MDQEYGDENGDNISQSGFSEYLVKGTVVSAANFTKEPHASQGQDKKDNQGVWETPKVMRKKLNSRVAGLDTLSMHQQQELDQLCNQYDDGKKANSKFSFFDNFNPKKVKLNKQDVKKVYLAKQSLALGNNGFQKQNSMKKKKSMAR